MKTISVCRECYDLLAEGYEIRDSGRAEMGVCEMCKRKNAYTVKAEVEGKKRKEKKG